MIARRDIESSPFKILQDQALARIQELSGNRWTDFNEHDPGVTILDTLHYALLELQYTLQFSFESYLVAGKQYGHYGLLSPQELFESSVVTPQDYENLILEKIETVVACRVTLLPNHRYLIKAEIMDMNDIKNISQQIEQLYHANRNLCETLQNVSIETRINKRGQNKPANDSPEYKFFMDNVEAIITFSKEYESVQNHFPDCYGINEKGMPAGISSEHKARIKQLQAYLLIFDYLLANTKHQVGNIPQLLELSGKIPSNNLPEVLLEGIENLIDKNRFSENHVNDEHFLHLQKSRYLDTLDTLYGEDTQRYFAKEDLSEANRKRAKLIRLFPRFNAQRFRSFDILKGSGTGSNIPGIKQFLSAITGSSTEYEISVVDLFGRYNLRLISDNQFFREHKNLNIEFITEYIEHNLFDYEAEVVPEEPTAYDDKRFHKLKFSINLFWHNILFESFLIEGSNPMHYKMVGWHKTNGYLLIFKIPGKREWLNIGLFNDKQSLIEAANLLWQFLKMLKQQSQQIYLVEHILLNDAQDDYNVLTIAVPHWVKSSFKQKEYETLLLERLPAHLDIRFLWLQADEMYGFEKMYYEWRQALSEKDEQRITVLSTQIRFFIFSYE